MKQSKQVECRRTAEYKVSVGAKRTGPLCYTEDRCSNLILCNFNTIVAWKGDWGGDGPCILWHLKAPKHPLKELFERRAEGKIMKLETKKLIGYGLLRSALHTMYVYRSLKCPFSVNSSSVCIKVLT